MRAVFVLVSLALLSPLSAQDKGEPKVFNLDKVNSDADETDPYLFDANNLLFASNKSGRFEIARSVRLSGVWGPAKVFHSIPDADVRGPFFYRGSTYFAANIVPDEKFADLKNFDIYRRIEQTAPIPLPGVAEREDEVRPWITPTGAEFYFSRKLKEGWTLMVANGPMPGPIGKARSVGFEPGFSHATLSSTGLTMYLQGPVEEGRLGIFRSTRPRVGAAWAKPAPVEKLNHSESKLGEQAPCLSPDGTRLYFASDRPGGKGGLDLWGVVLAGLK